MFIKRKNMNGIENKLSICITTYNRCRLLDDTLKSISESPLRNCQITILNNKSTDDTLKVCKRYSDLFPNFEVITYPVNLGGGCENYIHAIEYCDNEYMWILADDDTYDFSSFGDVEKEILSGRSDIIQVGAHNEGIWDWGVCDTPRNLMKKGYDYLRFSSFLPCTIFRYSYFASYIKEAYGAIYIRYPHMPCLIHAYLDNTPIYVSKKRIVKAGIGNQAYQTFIPRRGFLLLSDMMEKKEDKRNCIKAQIDGGLGRAYLRYVYYGSFPNNLETSTLFKRLFSVLTLGEKFEVVLGYIPTKIIRFINIKGRTLAQ